MNESKCWVNGCGGAGIATRLRRVERGLPGGGWLSSVVFSTVLCKDHTRTLFFFFLDTVHAVDPYGTGYGGFWWENVQPGHEQDGYYSS